ncbi:MAG TPA: Hsp70 family protein [Anaerolineae bacterium]|nr:Hsp70 family protein [Anaerolineae bacterium]
MSCVHCGEPLMSEEPVVVCEGCGQLNQLVPSVLAQDLRIKTMETLAVVLIPRYTPLPLKLTELFSTGMDDQATLEIHLVQGDKERVADNRYVGRVRLGKLTPRPKGVHRILCKFWVSEEGALDMEVAELGSENKETYGGMQVAVWQKSKSSFW